MAFFTECVTIIRWLINDLSSAPTYTDQRLEELLLVAAQYVNQEIDFAQSYVVDADELTLTPDPTLRSSRDEPFINLTCLKAACILDVAETRTATGQSIAIKDGSSSIDLRGNAASKLALLKAGWCAQYQMAKEEFLEGNRQSVGAIILTPFKIYSNGSAVNRFDEYR